MTATHPDLAWFYSAIGGASKTDLDQRLDADDAVISGLAAYLALRQDQAVPDQTLARVATALQREVDGKANEPCPTWLLALWAAVLRIADRRGAQPRFASLLARVKNHAYLKYTRAGTLMGDSHKLMLDHSILLAAVPFGLFEPEDLALVAAVKELANGPEPRDEDRLLLAWYYS